MWDCFRFLLSIEARIQTIVQYEVKLISIATNSFVAGAFARTGSGASTTDEFGTRLSNTGFGGLG